MKNLKIIFTSFILSFGILCYFGHGFVDNYRHLKSDIENTNNNSRSNNIVATEHPMEEEVSFIVIKNSIQILNSGSERFFTTTFNSPVQPVYPIWLPPKVS